MGGMCSSCSDTSQAEEADKQRQGLLPEVNHVCYECLLWDIKIDRNNPTQIQKWKAGYCGKIEFCFLNEENASSLRKSTDLNNFDNLFEDLAKFMKNLPAKSKKHIWEHAVIEKDKKDKAKKVFDKTIKQEQITRLLCDCVIVYVKGGGSGGNKGAIFLVTKTDSIFFYFIQINLAFLNRKEKPLKTQTVLPFVEPASKWIFENHGQLERQRFEEESGYFPGILEQYQVILCVYIYA
ncbi:hypothetical protein RFI_07270 [Reticulomyxa filosa]|uniref:Uncharacterized protein n=1 Tax=Reticulomyxa filosa TaxID=46433 RepID=X6NU80_RETFI|nr:hypothetical protein RFI_07270 [Reticulomyxa filosa]|eukprot:ETO29850.1 hypothetical protein RFI_07270 [Reticulomyxa filosa]